jgi:hypothetical protein
MHAQGQREEARGGPFGVGLEGREVGRRLAVQIGLAGIEQPVERRPRQAVAVHHLGQGFDDRMGARTAPVDLVDRLAPPLQANPPDHGLAHDLRRLGDLEVESIKSKEILAALRRGEQGGQIAVPVLAADLIGAGAEAGRGHVGFRGRVSNAGNYRAGRRLRKCGQPLGKTALWPYGRRAVKRPESRP